MSDVPRLLVVDGVPHRLRTTSKRFKSAGYKVIEATNGGDGMRLAKEHKPDLLLLDDSLPDIGAVEACQRLRADGSLGGMGIILLSDAVQAFDDQTEGLKAGADRYLSRCVSDDEFLEHVEAVLRRWRANRELRESA